MRELFSNLSNTWQPEDAIILQIRVAHHYTIQFRNNIAELTKDNKFGFLSALVYVCRDTIRNDGGYLNGFKL